MLAVTDAPTKRASAWRNLAAATANLASAAPEPKRPEVAKVKGKVTKRERAAAQLKASKVVFVGSVAAVFGAIVSGLLGLRLLEAISEGTRALPRGFSRSMDVFITGLAIAGGTKPLHDLIGRIQNAKDKSKPAEPGTDDAAQAGDAGGQAPTGLPPDPGPC